MPSPYRETDNAPPAPLAELAWRRRVARSARWATLLALAGIPVLAVTHWLLARFVLAGVVVWCMVGAALVVATWMLTARRPGGHVGFEGWLVRGSALVSLALGGLLLESAGRVAGVLAAVPLKIATYVAATLHLAPNVARLLGSALGFAWDMSPLGISLLLSTLPALYFFTRFGKWPGDGGHREPGSTAWSFVVATVFGALCFELPPIFMLGGISLLLTAYAFDELRHKVLPAEQQWWFDNQAGAPGEWVPLLVYRAGPAEVVWNDRRPGWFHSRQRAMGWLSQRGYLPAERALAERLVDRVPTDTVPLLKPRRPPQPRKNKKRVRVAPEPSDGAAHEAADAASDEMDDNAPPDEPERPRVVAVHDPRDPRA